VPAFCRLLRRDAVHAGHRYGRQRIHHTVTAGKGDFKLHAVDFESGVLGRKIETLGPHIGGLGEPERDGVLMVGDSAGFVDPFVGDGISLALRSGALAARSLQPFFAGKTSLAEAVSGYGQAYRESLLPVFRASSTIRRMLVLPDYVRKPVLSILESSPVITNYLVRKTR
jgi:flavin-dependent dehydrogenase